MTPRSGPDLVAVGEAMVVLRPVQGSLAVSPEFSVSVAGAELNACAAAAALGGDTVFVTRFGDDPWAARIRRHAVQLGVGVDAETDATRPTGVFFAETSPDMERVVHYYRAGSAASTIDEHTAADAARLHGTTLLISGLTAALGDHPFACFRRLTELASASGAAMVVDANLRRALGIDTSVEAIRQALPLTTRLVLGRDEGLELFGSDDPLDIISAARAAGCAETVVKAGADGAYCLDRSGALRHVPAVKVTVADTVGAGDAFTGAFAWARGRGYGPVAATTIGVRIAARVVTAIGDSAGLPSPDEARLLLDDVEADE